MTIVDWVAATQAYAYSAVRTRSGRAIDPVERDASLEQLIHEQQIEQRSDSAKYRHMRDHAGAVSLDEPASRDVEVALGEVVAVGRFGDLRVPAEHLIQWLDPVYEQVARELQEQGWPTRTTLNVHQLESHGGQSPKPTKQLSDDELELLRKRLSKVYGVQAKGHMSTKHKHRKPGHQSSAGGQRSARKPRGIDRHEVVYDWKAAAPPP